MKSFPLSSCKALVFGCALLAALPALSQPGAPPEEERARLLAGKKRSLIAFAGPAHSFTLDVTAQSAKVSDIPGFITVDKQILQSTLVPIDKPADATGLTADKQKLVLLRYMNYELDYYRKKLKQHYSHLQTEWVTLGGRLFLLWYFDMPGNYKLVSRQVYISTLFYDRVMDLNAPVFKTGDWGKARMLLLKLAGTMKTFDKHLDLDALRKKL
jgi:hypothetical protein